MKINKHTIIKDSNPLIREKSKDVSLPLSKEDEELLRSMLQYVKDSTDEEKAEKYDLQPAVGISAIQVGIPKKLTAVVVHELDKNDEPITHEYMLVNPRIISSSVQKAYLSHGEGCLSVEDIHEGYVVRHARIKVSAYDLCTNQEITIRARDYLAIVLQHEFDHFDGTLYYDHIDEDSPFTHPDDAIEI